MNGLKKAMGEPPYTIQASAPLIHEAQETLERAKSGAPFDAEAVTRVIDHLEAFGTITIHDHYIWLSIHKLNMPANKVQGMTRISELIMELKEHLFRRLGLSARVKSPETLTQLCQHCYWALSRMDAAIHPADGYSYYHCGTWSKVGYLRTATYPHTRGELQGDCSFCQILKTAIPVDAWGPSASVWIEYHYSSDEITMTSPITRRCPNILRFSVIRVLDWNYGILACEAFMLESRHGKIEMMWIVRRA